MEVRFAVIGSNFIVERFLAGAALCPNFALAAVYSRTQERAQALAHKWGAPHAHATLEALAADETVDAVYIASPNVCHAPQAIQMLRAGKHVLCEKAIATCLAEFDAMCAAARENGVVLMEAMRSAHGPALPLLQEAVQKLGTLRTAHFSYCQFSSRYKQWQNGVTENAFNPAMCGGALMDIGVYCVHMLVMLLGVPQNIIAEAAFLTGSIDAYGGITAQYAGMTARLNYSKIHDSHLLCEVAGEAGALQFTPVGTPRTAQLILNGETQNLPLTISEQDMHYEVEDFIEMIHGQDSGERYLAWSRSAMQIMQTVRTQTGIDFAPHMPQALDLVEKRSFV